MKLVLLDGDTLGSDANLEAFNKFGDFVIYPSTSKNDTLDRVKDANIVITNKVVIDKEIMDLSKNLKLICIAATGMNNVDLEYAKKRGIEVKNVAGYSTQSVAQHTLMQVLSLMGKNQFYDNYVKSGQWVKSPIFVNLDRPFHDIEDKRWGVIGLGSIGQKVALLADAFGCKISYYSTSGTKHSTKYEHLDLEELLSLSDIVTIHAPLNEKTNNLLDKNQLALMKQDAILVNVARGGIVNEQALVDAINSEKIYASIDVLTKEPMDANSPYLQIKKADRVLFSPHLAWASVEARKRLIDKVVENIENFIKG